MACLLALFSAIISGACFNIKTIFRGTGIPTATRAPSQYKDQFIPGMGIPMLKIRRSQDRLIFNMRIPILVRWHLSIEMSTRLGLCNSLGPILVRHLSTEMAPRFGLCSSPGPILVRHLYIEMAPRLGGMCNSLWPILVRRPLYIEMAPRLELCNSLGPILVRHLYI